MTSSSLSLRKSSRLKKIKNKISYESNLIVKFPTSARNLVISISVNISKQKMIRELYRFQQDFSKIWIELIYNLSIDGALQTKYNKSHTV